MTFFYRYDGKNISLVGSIEGFYGKYPGCGKECPTGSVIVDGSGIVKTLSRGDILHTWYYEDEYKLANNHIFKKNPKDLYEME